MEVGISFVLIPERKPEGLLVLYLLLVQEQRSPTVGDAAFVCQSGAHLAVEAPYPAERPGYGVRIHQEIQAAGFEWFGRPRHFGPPV